MNKLYHLFYVSSYKGGELFSRINYTLENIVEDVADWCYWDDLREYVADEEYFAQFSDEEFYGMSNLDILDKAPDEMLEQIVSERILYPGNMYAFDSHSDYQCYTTNDKGELIKINPIREEGFIKLLRDKLKEYYE